MFAAGGRFGAVVVDLRAAVGGVADERGPVSEGVADRLLDRVKLAVSRAADHPRGAISKTEGF